MTQTTFPYVRWVDFGEFTSSKTSYLEPRLACYRGKPKSVGAAKADESSSLI